ncbi:hypothetical protein [Actinocrispum wychmicini]|uniref:Uncharacterized protein n=1 Tax=Actinocrispum wychmicini TaxID=1213861 RepID=A0A4R2K598_9PSEU|nr:hypothetical protein [Actinocrispum wychmicini]TCO64958.1 hypothetical protein EV192_101742 [Actinocrispum wychmicini]
MTFFAGQFPTAADLNAAVALGQLEMTVAITSNSSTWSSGTKVLGPGGTFTAVVGANYAVTLDCALATGAGVANPSFVVALVSKAGGAAVATDPVFAAKPITCVTSSAFYAFHVGGLFTATASGIYGVAAVGWLLLGTGSGYISGDGTNSIGRLNIYRVTNP